MHLSIGQPVKYWSTSQGRWIPATVSVAGAGGAVQLNVKPKVWMSRLEQAARVRRCSSADVEKERGVGAQTSAPASPGDPHSSGYPSKTGQVQTPPRKPITPSTPTTPLEWLSGGDAMPALPGTAPTSPNGVNCQANSEPKAEKSHELFHLFSEWQSKKQQTDQKKKEGQDASARMLAANRGVRLRADQLRPLEAALLQQPARAMQGRVLQQIWRVFYSEIHERITELKKAKDTATGEEKEEDAEALESALISLSAILEETEMCLQRLCASAHKRLVHTQSPPQGAASSSSDTGGAARAASLRVWQMCTGQLHVMLADIERYRAIHGVRTASDSLHRAEQLYWSALEVFPQIGQAYNQLGLLAAQRNDHITAVVCGFRALVCAVPFPSCRENLLAWLERVAESGTGIIPDSSGSRCISSACHLQRDLLRGDAAQAEEFIWRTCDELRTALASSNAAAAISSGTWLTDLVLINVCSAVYHVQRGQGKSVKEAPQDANHDNITSIPLSLDEREPATATDPISMVVKSLLARFRESLAEAATDEEIATDVLKPLVLLSLLCGDLLSIKADWEPSTYADDENSDSNSLLRYALPEDSMVRGLLTTPLRFDSIVALEPAAVSLHTAVRRARLVWLASET
eukprot:TRINITY_DN55056_c0_g1_i2.p1 TRINITY_DN55056_c0_g1~~TRINITY_DN55056_c0_g1_i2.p1  ORF type:complete len:634 (+),score=97.74 TRINITY_DN55056_c0_g1_i2:140-2041(+)